MNVRALCFLVVLTIGVLAPGVAFAEPVECPNCWRMVDEGPCVCPFCEHALPGRVCPAEEPTAEAPPPTEQPEATPPPQKQPPQKRRPAARRRPSKSGEGGAGKAPRRRRRPRPPSAEGGEERPEDQQRPPRRRRPEADEGEGGEGDEGATPRRGRRPEAEEGGEERAEGEPPRRRRRRPPRTAAEREHRERAERARRRRRPPPEEQEEPAPLVGPSLLVGYRYYGLYHWRNGGHTNGIFLEGFPVAERVPWLRLGVGLELALRGVGDHTDWNTRAFGSIGLQYPHRVTPYGSVNVGGGMMYRKRFAKGVVDGLFTVGFDAGATFRVTSTFVTDLGVGYLYGRFDGVGYHSFTARISLGW